MKAITAPMTGSGDCRILDLVFSGMVVRVIA
jgi:hypothetical protein